MIQTITVPASLTPTTLLPFSIELSAIHKTDAYLFDFQNVGHVEPFGMLFLAALIRQFARGRRQVQGRDCEIKAENFKDKTYASWMGFFKSFGLDHGNEPGEAPGSDAYIPLTRLTVSRIVVEAREDYVHHGEIIEKEASRIAKILTRENEGQHQHGAVLTCLVPARGLPRRS